MERPVHQCGSALRKKDRYLCSSANLTAKFTANTRKQGFGLKALTISLACPGRFVWLAMSLDNDSFGSDIGLRETMHFTCDLNSWTVNASKTSV